MSIRTFITYDLTKRCFLGIFVPEKILLNVYLSAYCTTFSIASILGRISPDLPSM